jgi:hypothetical protein
MLHDLDRRHSSPTRGNELSDHPYIFRKFFSGLNACQRIVGFWVHKFFVLVWDWLSHAGDAAFGHRGVIKQCLPWLETALSLSIDPLLDVTKT